MKKFFESITVILVLFVSAHIAFCSDSVFIPDNANFFIYSHRNENIIILNSKLAELGLKKDFSKLSSAKRITEASDDPSGLAVAEKMTSLITGLRREAMNAEDMKNYLNFVEASLAENSALLGRIRELAISAQSSILSESDCEIKQVEIDQMLDEINKNSQHSEFNKIKVIRELTTCYLGVEEINVLRDPGEALTRVDNALERVLKFRASAGSKSNVLSFQINGKTYYKINLQETESRIRDLDMAKGISSLIKNSTLLKSRYGTLLLVK